LKQDYNKEISL